MIISLHVKNDLARRLARQHAYVLMCMRIRRWHGVKLPNWQKEAVLTDCNSALQYIHASERKAKLSQNVHHALIHSRLHSC